MLEEVIDLVPVHTTADAFRALELQKPPIDLIISTIADNDCSAMACFFCDAGFRVFQFDYRGFGHSDRAKLTNRGLADMDWAMLTSTDPVREVDQDALEARPPEAVLLDVREPQEFADGHVPGARNLPQAELATRSSELPRDRPLYLICQGGFRSLRAGDDCPYLLNRVRKSDTPGGMPGLTECVKKR